jgi:TetR/AcrR family transcriptional regulator
MIAVDDYDELTVATRRTYVSAGRDEQKRETRGRLLECALRLFSEKGFEATSLRDIAAEAEVSHAVIRVHFGTKDELWRSAIDLMFERQEEELGLEEWNKMDELTSVALRGMIRRYVRYCARHPEHVRIMIHDTLRDSERVRWIVDTHIKRVQAPIVRLLPKAMAKGVVRRIPIHSFMYILTSSSQMIFALGAEAKHLFGLDVAQQKVVDAHAEAICQMLLQEPPKTRPPKGKSVRR